MEKLSNRERLYPLKELAKMWLNDFVLNEKTYLENLIPMIISGDFSKMTKQEKEILSEIRNNLSKNEWKNFRALFLGAVNSIKKETKNAEIRKLAENYLLNDDFLNFEVLFSENKTILKDFEISYNDALNIYIKNLYKKSGFATCAFCFANMHSPR